MTLSCFSRIRSMFSFVENYQVKNVSSSLCITSLVVNLSNFADKSIVVFTAVEITEGDSFYSRVLPQLWFDHLKLQQQTPSFSGAFNLP